MGGILTGSKPDLPKVDYPRLSILLQVAYTVLAQDETAVTYYLGMLQRHPPVRVARNRI